MCTVADFTICMQFPAMFAQQLERRLPNTIDSFHCAAYPSLPKGGEATIYPLLIQDALVQCAPDALVATFLQVDTEFLRKDVVRFKLGHILDLNLIYFVCTYVFSLKCGYVQFVD